jgi:hypothetical protein
VLEITGLKTMIGVVQKFFEAKERRHERTSKQKSRRRRIHTKKSVHSIKKKESDDQRIRIAKNTNEDQRIR